jgi:hypothetical protein
MEEVDKNIKKIVDQTIKEAVDPQVLRNKLAQAGWEFISDSDEDINRLFILKVPIN